MNRRLIFTVITLFLLVGGTFVAIRYAQGYRLSRVSVVKTTGLLSANSFPNGASVYINGNLTSATDTTLNLNPGEYEVEIKKEGFFPWKKTLKLESELVTQTNALLFPTAPGLTPLTFIGAQNAHPSPDGQKILFTTASASAARNNGLYVIDLTDNPLALQKGPRQIARSTTAMDLNKAQLVWAPDSDQILVKLAGKTFLLDEGRNTDLETALDVSISYEETLLSWKQLETKKVETQLAKFPPIFQEIASVSARAIHVSPDQDKVTYTVTSDIKLPDALITKVPASNSQPQARDLKAGNTYVYDRREDRNFLIAQGKVPETEKKPAIIDRNQATISWLQETYSGLYTQSPQWLPDSRHLIFLRPDGIHISEYDGTNMTQVYAGPLTGNFVYPWPNGSKLLILTNFNQPGSVPQNLYAVSLR